MAVPINNFCRVFELPLHYPEGFLFHGGKPVQMLMVDWFNPWPSDVGCFVNNEKPPETWADVVKQLKPWIIQKKYVKPGRQYILVTDFGESMMFGHGIP